MTSPAVHHLWAMYAALGLAFTLIGSALLLIVVPPLVRALREWKWRRHKRRFRGDLIEAMERELADWPRVNDGTYLVERRKVAGR